MAHTSRAGSAVSGSSEQLVRHHLVTLCVLAQLRELTPGKDIIQIHGLPQAGRVRSSSSRSSCSVIDCTGFSMTLPSDDDCQRRKRSPVTANITRFDEPACHSLMSA
jgi:hypothetical protein